MILIEPTGVTIDGVAQAGVLALAVEEAAVAPVEERGEGGPYAVFVDSPARAVRVIIKQEVIGTTLDGPRSGQMVDVVARLSAAGAEAGAKSLFVRGCVLEVRYDLSAKVPTRRLTLAAVSDDGAESPVNVT